MKAAAFVSVLGVVLVMVINLAIWGGLIYAAIHFAAKL